MRLDWRAILAIVCLTAGLFLLHDYKEKEIWENVEATERGDLTIPIRCIGDCKQFPDSIAFQGNIAWLLITIVFALLIWITLKPKK